MFYSSYLIKAAISLLKKGGRKLPISDGYQPICKFSKYPFISGVVEIVGKKELYPGESSEVLIRFPTDEYLLSANVDDTFELYEGSSLVIGHGVIIEKIGWVTTT